MKKEQILNLLKQELPHLKEKFKVKSIGLFGSCVREEQTEKSDRHACGVGGAGGFY